MEKAAAAKLLVDEAAAAAAATAMESSMVISDNGHSNAEVENVSEDVEVFTAPASELALSSCPQTAVADTVIVDDTDRITMSDDVTDSKTLEDMSYPI